MSDFTELYFGKAAAENEVASNPSRFMRTYLDRWDLPRRFENHERFLLLGPKGSGKSAAARYVDLKWKAKLGRHAVFSTFLDFDDLNRTLTPLVSLDKKLVSEFPALTDSAWRLFIAVRLLETLSSDPMCQLSRDPQVAKFIADLQAAGLASNDYPQVLRRVRERRGGIVIPNVLKAEQRSIETQTMSPGQIGDAALKLVLTAQTPNRHLLVIDGLDKAISDNKTYWHTLAALIRVADSFCRDARAAGASAYVLILCRSDVFRHARFTDAPKVAGDAGIHLEWGAELANPRDVMLWDYLGRKAGIDIDHLFDVLPVSIPAGGYNIELKSYLLNFTRYTPRDMTLLFNNIQDAVRELHGDLNATTVRRGADRFASRQFLTELTAEATGLLPASVVDEFDQIFSDLPSRVFTVEELGEAISRAGVASETTTDKLGEYLFLQGAIGNLVRASEPENYIQFYHRRDTYKFRRSGPWVLHTALVYAFNKPWRRPNSL
jgi:hypothetical protein